MASHRTTQGSDKQRALTQETDSKTVMNTLTIWRERFEDIGFIGKKNADLTKATIAALRKRQARTTFHWVKGHNGHPRNEEADKLAGAGARKQSADEIETKIPRELQLTGAKLQCITQALAYKAIREKKMRKLKTRPTSARNIERIIAATEDAFGVKITEGQVWRGFRNKAIMPECANFLWTSVHNAYMVGSKWLEIYDGSRPEHDEKRARATCKKCNVMESMEHILFQCDSPGQKQIWDLAERLWRETGRDWRAPNFGTVMGAACAVFTDREGERIRHLERLWVIIITTSAYLIWKIRCERVIRNDAIDFSPREVQSRWRSELNRRLDLDRRMTHKRHEKKALTEGLVISTWRPVIRDFKSLPPRWVGDSGVLVGIKGG
ncbi:hypothetical protein EV121DRAFT_283310 [Schizophyllum commune]